jgi:hypothetical protein
MQLFFIEMAKFYSTNQSTRNTKARNRETNVQEYTKEQQLKGHANTAPKQRQIHQTPKHTQ